MQRRRLVHAAAWTLATGAAVTLSWWGVHTVLAGTAYDPPRALPVSGAPAKAEPRSSSTHRPKPTSSSPTASRSPSASSGKQTPSRPPDTGSAPDPEPSHSRQSPASPSSSGKVESTSVDGGRAVFDMGKRSATLVSATPNAGWDMRVWKSQQWIRVTFTKSDGTETSVFCRWDEGAPRIEKFAG